MRNAEAARYARWAALAAFAVAVLVAGVYAGRAWKRVRALRHAPPPVPPTVQQQSAQFSFSKVEGDRTIFTVLASRAIQFKDSDRSVLEDVSITIYGRDGSRNDSIHTHECSYETRAGSVRCEGEAQIVLQNAGDERRQNPRTIQIQTKDISFNRDSGEAQTAQPVLMRFPDGEGRAMGVLYDASDATLRLEKNVEIQIQRPSGAFASPTRIRGTSLTFSRRQSRLRLAGPVLVDQGSRKLTADSLVLSLDANLHPRTLVANGHTELRSTESARESSVTANRIAATLNPLGRIERILAEGELHGAQEGSGHARKFTGQELELEFAPRANALRQIVARGGITLESQAKEEEQRLETQGLTILFDDSPRPIPRSAETLAPASVVLHRPEEETRIHGKQLSAQLNARGSIEEVLGHGAVEIDRLIGASEPQAVTADDLAMWLAAGGDWSQLEMRGHVRYRQADRTAEAQTAQVVRATDVISLDGSPVVADSESRTTASEILINQRTGEIHANGAVRTSFSGASRGGPGLGAGPAFLTADSLAGNSQTGEVIYTPHARLWQGNSVLDADRIEIWRDGRRLEARGNVLAVFEELPSAHRKGSKPALWKVTAPLLQYSDAEAHVRLEGGVHGASDQAELTSRNLDLYLTAGGPNAAQRQVERAVASGAVVLRQSGRQGTSEQAEYTAGDGKIVLTGGPPTLQDASGNATTGHSLTFFLAGDTILVDSEKDRRTLTKHRIEK